MPNLARINQLPRGSFDQFISQLPCAICSANDGNSRVAQVYYLCVGGAGPAPGEDPSVPLCLHHYQERYACEGGELEWWRRMGRDPEGIASVLSGYFCRFDELDALFFAKEYLKRVGGSTSHS